MIKLKFCQGVSEFSGKLTEVNMGTVYIRPKFEPGAKDCDTMQPEPDGHGWTDKKDGQVILQFTVKLYFSSD